MSIDGSAMSSSTDATSSPCSSASELRLGLVDVRAGHELERVEGLAFVA